MDCFWQSCLLDLPSVPVSRPKTEGKRAGPFENLDSLPDDVDYEKLTKVIVTNDVAAFITNTRTFAPLDDESDDISTKNTLTTHIRVPYRMLHMRLKS